MTSTFVESELSSYSDSQIAQFIQILPSVPGHPRITYLSQHYVAKAFRDKETEDALKALEYAHELEIRVPRIRRIVRDQDVLYCVMDRVQGKSLHNVWPGFSWVYSIRLAFQLRGMINRLQAVQSTTAGSLATGRCRSFYLDDSYGLPPKASTEQVDAFINFWNNFTSIRHEIEKTSVEHSKCLKPVLSTTPPMVLVHHDLAPRNIMLDADGQLWLIDWDYAGFYPKFFEFAGMHNFLAPDWTQFAMWRWKLFTYIAAGFYSTKARWLEKARWRFTRFRFARRFNMKFSGYAAAARRPDTED